jgi:hypothetical protein
MIKVRKKSVKKAKKAHAVPLVSKSRCTARKAYAFHVDVSHGKSISRKPSGTEANLGDLGKALRKGLFSLIGGAK